MAARRHPLAGLSIDRNLRRFVLQGRPTGKVLGTGSYGTVEEVMNLQIKHNVLFGYLIDRYPYHTPDRSDHDILPRPQVTPTFLLLDWPGEESQ